MSGHALHNIKNRYLLNHDESKYFAMSDNADL